METVKELKPLFSWFPSDLEEEDVNFEWEDLLQQIDELLKKVNPNGYWFCEVLNFGWRSLSGHAYMEFTTGQSMISKVLPKTECSFKVFKKGKTIKIQNYHHDSPTGNEWYELKPISFRKYHQHKYS